MANPAELLLDIFNEWHEDKNSAQNVRKDPSLEKHLQAARLIGELEEILDVLDSMEKRTGVYRRYLPAWKKTLFSYPGGWQSAGTAKISQVERDHLETLIDFIDGVVPKPEPAQLEILKGYLDQVLKELASDNSVPASVRDSAVAVVSNVLGCIDDINVLGDFAFAQAFERLLGCLALVALRSSKKDRWRRVLDGMVYPYAVNNLPALEDVPATFEAITSSVTGALH